MIWNNYSFKCNNKISWLKEKVSSPTKAVIGWMNTDLIRLTYYLVKSELLFQLNFVVDPTKLNLFLQPSRISWERKWVDWNQFTLTKYLWLVLPILFPSADIQCLVLLPLILIAPPPNCMMTLTNRLVPITNRWWYAATIATIQKSSSGTKLGSARNQLIGNRTQLDSLFATDNCDGAQFAKVVYFITY